MFKNGMFYFLHYDSLRQRLFGLRDYNLFTLVIEEYNLTTLHPMREYTRRNAKKYAYAFHQCSIFDYEENWTVEGRTRLENANINAYYLKMDLNLVGNKTDIVTEFCLSPDIHNLCTITNDTENKLALVA